MVEITKGGSLLGRGFFGGDASWWTSGDGATRLDPSGDKEEAWRRSPRSRGRKTENKWIMKSFLMCQGINILNK